MHWDEVECYANGVVGTRKGSGGGGLLRVERGRGGRGCGWDLYVRIANTFSIIAAPLLTIL